MPRSRKRLLIHAASCHNVGGVQAIVPLSSRSRWIGGRWPRSPCERPAPTSSSSVDTFETEFLADRSWRSRSLKLEPKRTVSVNPTWLRRVELGDGDDRPRLRRR